MGILDSISNLISTRSKVAEDRKKRFEELTFELNSLKKEYDSYIKDATGFISTSGYSELSRKGNEVELAAERELRVSRIVITQAYLNLRVAYESYLEANKRFLDNVKKHNDKILKNRVEDAYPLIGSVEGQVLDEQQMACIVKDAHSHLVIAGAGTGKTTTILGKVKYLLAKGIASPQEILILSFTNASAQEMKNRLVKETNQNFYVATFHKLGYDIIRRADQITPKVSQVEINKFVKDSLVRRLTDPTYQRQFINYLLFHRVEAKSEFEFDSEEDYNDYLETNPPTTIKNERVKSYGEMNIANYLALNGINYKYEAEYPIDTRTEEYRQYHPDFYLPDYGIYIEYYGINRNGDVPSYFSDKDGKDATLAYLQGIKWKRELHKKHETKLIECYAYENMEGTLLESLKTKLLECGVVFKEQSFEELAENSGQNAKSILSTIADTMSTVITLCRNRRYDSAALITGCVGDYKSQRPLAELIAPIMDEYVRFLSDNDYVDFADMLNRAEDLTRANAFVNKFKYVIVDEYQDISSAQYRLLQAMRDQTDYDLFCVGDDWQSIYRFAGSDIGYILYFQKYWGDSELSRISTTYRFSQKLIDISSSFIMENPNQIKKYMVSGKGKDQLVLGRIHGYTDRAAMQFMASKLDSLPKKSSVFLIGRYTFDIDLLKLNEAFTLKYDNAKQGQKVILKNRSDLDIRYYTAHRSKGLQADYVFIINNRGTYMGFPSKVENPLLVEMLLEQADQYPDAEERRLYYVALTRAKNRIYLVTYGNSISPFAKALIDKYKDDIKKEAWSCPLCGGQLKKIKGPYGDFYGCSNYRTTGCSYKRIIVASEKENASTHNA